VQRSTSRILTTHTGSLPRSPGLQELLRTREEGRQPDEPGFERAVREAVADIVRRQTEIGLDVVNDGEQGRSQYATYVKERLSGFEGERVPRGRASRDLADFPGYRATHQTSAGMPQPACTGPIAWRDRDAIRGDIARLQAAVDGPRPVEAFMTAPSPGVIAHFLPNAYYPDDEAYLYALAGAMKEEYQAIVGAGLVLQVDCPDLAMSRNYQYADLTREEFRERVALHVRVIDHALAGLPADRMRLHLCWGNYEGPHHHDVPLREIVDLVLGARPAAISFEGANPRHAHEWKVWSEVRLPDDKVIVPGVLDTTTNFIEHPELIAQRLARYAGAVGRERVIAGTDCGFGTSAWGRKVDAKIAWAKLQAMVEGARLASKALW
jgi:5-methyltetrahydropteroyltriglutamate--homocysteine methyltransferase